MTAEQELKRLNQEIKQLREMKQILDEVFEYKKKYPLWYGIPGIKFIFVNEWADPLIEYKGRRCSCFIIEDTMLERFHEDDLSDPEEFGRYMQENADEVYELCELALFGEE